MSHMRISPQRRHSVLLAFIQLTVANGGFSPSIRQVARVAGVPPSSCYRAAEALARARMLRRTEWGQWYCYEATRMAFEAVGLQVICP